MARKNRPETPDGRYLVARGLLKRCSNPELDDKVRRKSVKALMQARMSNDKNGVIAAKTELGETGPVWWDDGAPDYSGSAPVDTVYADWWNALMRSVKQERQSQNQWADLPSYSPLY